MVHKTLIERPKTLTELGGVLLNWLNMSKEIKEPVISLSSSEFSITCKSMFFNQGRRSAVVRLTIAPDGRYYSHLESVGNYLPIDAIPLVKLIQQLHKAEVSV